MKKILILGTALLCGFLCRVAAQGVEFRDLTFGQALEQARTENKLVFMDCYTSWCGPCKNMLKNVFTLPEAGEFMNAHFVCVKYDMEKGEGIGLKKQFAVRAFPTFFIIRLPKLGRYTSILLSLRSLSPPSVFFMAYSF